MISVSLTFFSLFVCGLTQYRGYSYSYNYRNTRPTYPSANSQDYRYNYGYNYGNVRPTYPVNTQNYAYSSNYGTLYPTYPVSTQNYAYQQSSCRSPCNSCQYLPCYNNYAQQPYYQPHNYYNARQQGSSGSPYFNYYGNSRTTSSDPYANVPVDIIDDDSLIRQTLSQRTNNNRLDQYANVPVEIIDENNSGDFWKNIPILPKVRTSSHSNYTVTKGEVTNNTVTENKPIKAVITRSFQPVKKQPDVKIDFLNGVPSNNVENKNTNSEEGEDTNEISENTTIVSEEETTAVINELTEKESEEVSPVKSWFSS